MKTRQRFRLILIKPSHYDNTVTSSDGGRRAALESLSLSLWHRPRGKSSAPGSSPDSISNIEEADRETKLEMKGRRSGAFDWRRRCWQW